jgi:hypothetical protein
MFIDLINGILRRGATCEGSAEILLNHSSRIFQFTIIRKVNSMNENHKVINL